MQTQPSVLRLTVLLAGIAGFCDTTTFVAANSLLSAHITGNLVTFAADLAHHANSQAWLKLTSVPVFVAAVGAAPWLARRSTRSTRPDALLLAEGGVLLGAGLLALATAHYAPPVAGLPALAALLVVFAMGLQNAFGTLDAAAIYGPTTVMTGKLTEVVLDGLALLTTTPAPADKGADFSRQLPILGAFVGGCLLGGFAAIAGGLAVVLAPGLALLGYLKLRK